VTRIGPVDRVRARLVGRIPESALRSIPDGYQRLGSVLVVKLPEEIRRYFPEIGAAYRDELGVASVLRRRGPIVGEFRVPEIERIAGDRTETEVRENGVVYRFDAARIMFAAGNRTERIRLARLVRPGETVADLFAGIGYFTLPIAVYARPEKVVACEANPVSFGYLVETLRRNQVLDRVEARLGPNEAAPLPPGAFDRVVLGFLPSAMPWIPRAVGLLRPSGGWIHAHLVVGTREGVVGATSEARSAVARAGGRVGAADGRQVKDYGPGRTHVVVDLEVLAT